jgi:hypothetical protein
MRVLAHVQTHDNRRALSARRSDRFEILPFTKQEVEEVG